MTPPIGGRLLPDEPALSITAHYGAQRRLRTRQNTTRPGERFRALAVDGTMELRLA
jgi:hypothetical protein